MAGLSSSAMLRSSANGGTGGPEESIAKRATANDYFERSRVADQASRQPSSSTIRPPHMPGRESPIIAIVGNAKTHADAPAAAEALGRELAKVGFRILVYSSLADYVE